MTSALECGSSVLPSVPAMAAIERTRDPPRSYAQAPVPESLEKRKKNKRSRRRKSSGGKANTSTAGESLLISESLREVGELDLHADPTEDVTTNELEDFAPEPALEPDTDSGRYGIPHRSGGEVTSLSDGTLRELRNAASEEPLEETIPNQRIREASQLTETSTETVEAMSTESSSLLASLDKPQSREDLRDSPIPVISRLDNDEGDKGGEREIPSSEAYPSEEIAIQRIQEFPDEVAISVSDILDNEEVVSVETISSTAKHQVENEGGRAPGSGGDCDLIHENGLRSDSSERDRSSRTAHQVCSQGPAPDDSIHGRTAQERIIGEPAGNTHDIFASECMPAQDASAITNEPRSERGVLDQSPGESSRVGLIELFPKPNPCAVRTCKPSDATSARCEDVTPDPQELIQKSRSVSPGVAIPESAESCGLFVPLDAAVPHQLGASHRVRQRESRSPNYRNQANHKLQQHRKFQNERAVSQRPSKKLREECSMSSPVPGDSFDMDSLDTTADSISPDSSLAQDLTYDIVDDEPPKPRRKLFTFGLEAAEAALRPRSANRARKVSEESPSLASEEESDPQLHPGSAALQLSVSVSNGSNDLLAPCSISVEDLVRSQDSSADILSFAYVPGSHNVFVHSENVLQRRLAVRVVVSSRVEPFDEPADSHSSYVRSPRLESWCRKPAAIVSPMRAPALSKAVQTQSLPNFDSDEPSSRVVQGLRSALATYEQVISVLKRKLEDFSTNNSTSTGALTTELVVERSNNQKLEHTVNTLEKAVQSTMLRMGEVRSANSELREVVQSQLDSLTQYKSQIEDLHFEKDQLRASHENYAMQCEERIRREKHSFEKQTALMRAQMEMKNMELDRLQHEAKIMRDQLAACQKVINDLQQY